MFEVRWDQRDDYEPADFGSVGEDARGVWASVHPDLMLIERPWLWDVVAEYEAGIIEPTREDYHSKSAYEYQAKLVMSGAYNREQGRMIDRDPTDGS